MRKTKLLGEHQIRQLKCKNRQMLYFFVKVINSLSELMEIYYICLFPFNIFYQGYISLFLKCCPQILGVEKLAKFLDYRLVVFKLWIKLVRDRHSYYVFNPLFVIFNLNSNLHISISCFVFNKVEWLFQCSPIFKLHKTVVKVVLELEESAFIYLYR